MVEVSEDPIGFGKKKTAMPSIASLKDDLKELDDKEDKEDYPACPCPYTLREENLVVMTNLAHINQTSEYKFLSSVLTRFIFMIRARKWCRATCDPNCSVN